MKHVVCDQSSIYNTAQSQCYFWFAQIQIAISSITQVHQSLATCCTFTHFGNVKKNIARIANAVPFTLNSRVTMNDEIVVLNCQKCNQCLTGHKSRIIHSGCFLNVIVLIVFIVLTVPQKNPKNSNFSVRSCLLITLIKCLKGHRSLLSLFVHMSKVKVL